MLVADGVQERLHGHVRQRVAREDRVEGKKGNGFEGVCRCRFVLGVKLVGTENPGDALEDLVLQGHCQRVALGPVHTWRAPPSSGVKYSPTSGAGGASSPTGISVYNRRM